MKSIRHSCLRLQQGEQDQIYEIEIVAALSATASDLYLVNIRHGRYGKPLREGSKTPQPVSLSEAEALFYDAGLAKIRQGYRVVAGGDLWAEAVAENIQASRTSVDLPVRQQLAYQKFLQYRVELFDPCFIRSIWRLGELDAQQAIPDLLALLTSLELDEVDDTLIYTLIWALGRLHAKAALPAIQAILEAESTLSHVRRMAVLAIWQINPDPQWLEAQYQQLPMALRTLAEVGGMAERANQLLLWARTQKTDMTTADDWNEVWFAILYLQAKQNKALRQALLHLCHSSDSSALGLWQHGSFWLWRMFFKAAEFMLDPEWLAVLIITLETSDRALPEQKTWQYLRRRSWRLLRRLGELERPEYVAIATALLQQYDDKDGEPYTLVRYRFTDHKGHYHSQKHCQFPAFAKHTALNQILYRHSKQYRPFFEVSKGWYQCSEQVDEQRPEAFAALWDAQPQAFIDCLQGSRFTAAHQFALRGLSENMAFTSQVAAEDWVSVVCGPIAISTIFAWERLENVVLQPSNHQCSS